MSKNKTKEKLIKSDMLIEHMYEDLPNLLKRTAKPKALKKMSLEGKKRLIKVWMIYEAYKNIK